MYNYLKTTRNSLLTINPAMTYIFFNLMNRSFWAEAIFATWEKKAIDKKLINKEGVSTDMPTHLREQLCCLYEITRFAVELDGRQNGVVCQEVVCFLHYHVIDVF